MPVGFRIAFDSSARELRRGVWFGGQPARVLTLSAAGAAGLDELRAGPVGTTTAGLVARRFTEAGLAHPVPPPLAEPPDVTVVVPVHDRPDELDRCLAALGRAYPVIVVDDASRDELRIRAVAARHGAAVVRHCVNAGPAAARNTGLGRVGTDLVAFVDSDTVPDSDWIAELAAHLADPLLAAVAPRITALAGGTWAGRYTRARGSLDLGARPARVRPYTRVSYVPTAALLARTSALRRAARGGAVFDPALRVGEDVDLIWRLVAAGELVRFEPSTRILHAEPRTWRGLLRRRFRYGTAAGQLGHRHPDNIAPLVLSPWPTTAAAALLARRPGLAAAAAGVAAVRTGKALQRAGVPTARLVPVTAAAVGKTLLGISRYAVQFAAPALAASLVRGTAGQRTTAAMLLLTPAAQAWRNRGSELDPVRFAVGNLADDIAYGAGVLAGCLQHRTNRPLRPTRAHRRTH